MNLDGPVKDLKKIICMHVHVHCNRGFSKHVSELHLFADTCIAVASLGSHRTVKVKANTPLSDTRANI